jgi:hypothetical protein
MQSQLIVMLTQNDITVGNAQEVFESCKDLPINFWGFKNVGISQSRAENSNLLKKADLCSRSNRWCAAICLSTARQRHQIYFPGQRIG